MGQVQFYETLVAEGFPKEIAMLAVTAISINNSTSPKKVYKHLLAGKWKKKLEEKLKRAAYFPKDDDVKIALCLALTCKHYYEIDQMLREFPEGGDSKYVTFRQLLDEHLEKKEEEEI